MVDIKSQNHLASLLGISKGAASRLAARGMPTHSLEAAQAWRATHLDPARTKGTRFDPSALGAEPVQTSAPTPARVTSSPNPLERAASLLEIASSALGNGRPIDVLVPSLRSALAEVHPSVRSSLLLPIEVMDVLVAHVLEALSQSEELSDPVSQGVSQSAGASMSDEEAENMGAFWYSVAAGEIRAA